MGRLVKTTPAVQEQQEEKRTVVGTGANGRLVKIGYPQSTPPAVQTQDEGVQSPRRQSGTSPMFRQQPTVQQNAVMPKNQNALAQGLGKGALQQQEAKNYQSEKAFNQHVKDVKPQTVTQRVGNAANGVVDDAKHVVSAGVKGSAGSYLGAAGLFNEINAAVGEAVGNLIGSPEKKRLGKSRQATMKQERD